PRSAGDGVKCSCRPNCPLIGSYLVPSPSPRLNSLIAADHLESELGSTIDSRWKARGDVDVSVVCVCVCVGVGVWVCVVVGGVWLCVLGVGVCAFVWCGVGEVCVDDGCVGVWVGVCVCVCVCVCVLTCCRSVCRWCVCVCVSLRVVKVYVDGVCVQ